MEGAGATDEREDERGRAVVQLLLDPSHENQNKAVLTKL